MSRVDLLSKAPIWRDYPAIVNALPVAPLGVLVGEAREEAMRRAVDLMWSAFGDATFAKHGISWIGFYEKVADADEMVLICREPKPACSPIGLHGMCGRGWRDAHAFIVPDVRTLGANYVACDPKDQSEVVVPVINEDGTCWGVLDADSYDLGAFDEHDAEGMRKVMERLGVSRSREEHRRVMRI